MRKEFFELPPPEATSPVKLLMMGRISPWKGQLKFLEALVLLQNQLGNTNWHADIVGGSLFGESEYEKQIRDFLKVHSLERKVSMHGHVKDVTPYLAASNIVVHSSILPEPFGQVIAQGMAAGRAVIAANSGGPLDIITPNQDGVLVDPANTSAFAAALHELVLDSDRRETLGRAAKEKAKRYAVALVTEQVRKVLLP
ncbi:glycosyltransferase [Arthrobacter sp. MPF02]|uniref:glycosyltransferase n=1 Tax=Arthrobacter sp. MPF02 TaxID=3388492 RepID=UPI003985568C